MALDWNALNGPAMTKEQLEMYLNRIGLSGPVPLTPDGLACLQIAHLKTVPFENMDILRRVPLSLDHDALFDKIVVRKQGGVCAELNTAYNWLLYSLGFDVTSYNSRVAYPQPIQFRRHRVMGVRFGDKTYISDVGINLEYSRVPLLLEEGTVQSDGFCEYRYKRDEFFGWLQQQKKKGEDWKNQIGFTQEPQIDMDFDTALFYYEKHPGSVMAKYPRVSRYRENDMAAIRGHIWLEERGGLVVNSCPIEDYQEELKLIREEFGLDTGNLVSE